MLDTTWALSRVVHLAAVVGGGGGGGEPQSAVFMYSGGKNRCSPGDNMRKEECWRERIRVRAGKRVCGAQKGGEGREGSDRKTRNEEPVQRSKRKKKAEKKKETEEVQIRGRERETRTRTLLPRKTESETSPGNQTRQIPCCRKKSKNLGKRRRHTDGETNKRKTREREQAEKEGRIGEEPLSCEVRYISVGAKSSELRHTHAPRLLKGS